MLALPLISGIFMLSLSHYIPVDAPTQCPLPATVHTLTLVTIFDHMLTACVYGTPRHHPWQAQPR